MPYRRPRDGGDLPEWKQDLNIVHRPVRARAEHSFAHLKTWNILRNCGRKRDGVHHAACGVALMRNLTMTV
nr:transposase [Thermomonospora umbrina]